MGEEIFEPLKEYNSIYKQKIEDAVINKIDELIKKSNVDPLENEQSVKEINKLEDEKRKLEKQNSKYRFFKGFIIFLCIAFVIGGIFCTYWFSTKINEKNSYIYLLIAILLLVFMILLLVLKSKKVTPKLKEICNNLQKCIKTLDEKKQSALTKLYPLFNLLDFFTPFEIINDTVPSIQFTKTFDYKEFKRMNLKYGFEEIEDKDTSTYHVIAGELASNPFIIDRMLNTKMFNKTYEGTKVIHWTTTSTDSKGRRVTHYHSQTLVATFVAPAPLYSFNTVVCYANDAAPNSNFTRGPVVTKPMSKKELEKLVKKGENEIQKIHEKALKDPKLNFTEMGNVEFDALFHAFDRDNDVEFRLLFTPLAQKNMLDLIKTPIPYGDDFIFKKRKCLNYIISNHGQNADMHFDREDYANYDLKVSKQKFINYVKELFKSVYFDLAPIMAIPLYQQVKPKEYEYNDDNLDKHFPLYEIESLINSAKQEIFAHKDTSTQVILKASFVKKCEYADFIRVDAYSYKGEPRVAAVSVFGGDGRSHIVNVPWVEYFELVNTKYIYAFDNQIISPIKVLNCMEKNKKCDIMNKNNLCAFVADEEDYNIIESVVKESK